MSEQAPPWLMIMRAITGMTETEGAGDNPRILHMADAIAREYPHQADYCAYYTGDDIAWCGLTVGYCVTLAGIEPVFGETDTERWMWALAWADWPDSETLDKPKLGCIVVTEREGGGHVTLFEEMGDPGYYRCRGGNQSDQVNVTNVAISSVVKLVWPRFRVLPDIFSPELTADEIAWTQASLNLLDAAKLVVDGEMGSLTQDAIKLYQHHNLLPVTSVADRRTVDSMLAGLATWNEERYRDGK